MSVKYYATEEYVNEAIAGAGGGGVSSWNELADKPFYETIEEPITWDGNTEGLVCVEGFYKVSDAILSDETLKNSTITANNGMSFPISTTWDELVAAGHVTDDIVAFPESAGICVRKSGATFSELTFEETGVYFVKFADTYISKLTLPSQIKTLDEKFIPESIVRVTLKNTDWNEFTIDKTYEELVNAMNNSIPVYAWWVGDTGTYFEQLTISGSTDEGKIWFSKPADVTSSMVQQFVYILYADGTHDFDLREYPHSIPT